MSTNPLSISSNELRALSEEDAVVIRYNEFELEGHIGYIIVASNNPMEYETFEFTLSYRCKAKLKNNIKLIPKYFRVSDIQSIAKIKRKKLIASQIIDQTIKLFFNVLMYIIVNSAK